MAGFPTVLGIQLGVWGPRAFPILFRASSGLGSQAELGVHLPIDGETEKRLLIAASGGLIGYGLFDGDVMGNAGLSAGMRMGSFSFTAGPALYFGGGIRSAQLGAQGSVSLTVLY